MYIVTWDNAILFRTDSLDVRYSAISANLETGLNIAGQLTFQIAPDNEYYDYIVSLNGYVDVYRDSIYSDAIWSGRIVLTEKRFDLLLDVTCEGAFAILNDSKIMPFTYISSLSKLVEYVLAVHSKNLSEEQKIILGYMDESLINRSINLNFATLFGDDYISAMDILDYLRELYGGYMTVLRDYSSRKLQFNWYSDFDSTNTQDINFGQNLLNITYTNDAKDIITAVIPLGKDLGTLTSSKTIQTEQYNGSGKRFLLYAIEDSYDAETLANTFSWRCCNSPTSTSYKWAGTVEAYIDNVLVYSRTEASETGTSIDQSGTVTIPYDAQKGYASLWIRYKFLGDTKWHIVVGKIKRTNLSAQGTNSVSRTSGTCTKTEYYGSPSDSYTVRQYLILTVKETVLDVVNNRSKIEWRIAGYRYSDDYRDELRSMNVGSNIMLYINGVRILNHEDGYSEDGSLYYSFPTNFRYRSNLSGTRYIDHDADGTKTIDITFEYRKEMFWDTYSDGGSISTWTGTMTLTDLSTVTVVDTPAETKVTIEAVQENGYKEYVERSATANVYGIIPVVKEWSSVSDPLVLYNNAVNYLNSISKVKQTIDVSAVDLADAGQNVEHFKLRQLTNVTSKPHDIDAEQFYIERLKLDLYNPDKNAIEISREI